jgi:transglutaminase-like putative cysteine protease
MKQFLITALACCMLSQTEAQSINEINGIFPGELAVVKEHKVHYTIRLKDGVPEARSSEQQEILYLSENAGSYMSKFSFYHSSFHPVDRYEAYTETPGGKKIQVKEFKTSQSISSSVFYDDVKQTSFDFPSITPGSSGHLDLEKTHTNPRLLSPHYFSRGIPTLLGEMKISFPKDMSVRYLIRGNDRDKVQFNTETRKGETTYTFTVKNLQKDMNYPDAPDNAYYALHVIFWIEQYKAGDKTVSYMANLDDLYKLQWSFVKDINKSISPELKSITDSLTQGHNSPEQKARQIYKWVQKNIKYVAFEEGMEGFIPREANLVCSRRFGDCKDMSSILTVMLNHAGVPAYYTWIGTRALPYDYTEIHLPIVDNHMITAVRLDTNYIFLDGTDAHCVFGAPSGHIQGKQAMIGMNDKEYKIIRVPEYAREKSRLTDTTILDLTDKGILGTVKVNMTGYFAMDMHGVMSYTNEKDREKYMKGYFNRGSNKFKLNKFEISDTGNPDWFGLSGQFELQDYGKKIADEWYLNMNLFKFYEHKEIDFPKRNTPIEHEYKNSATYVTILNIPEGYKVAYLPDSKSYKNEVWGFDISYRQEKNQVIMTQTFSNEHLLLEPDKFQAWNKVLENLYPLYRETISLAKK